MKNLCLSLLLLILFSAVLQAQTTNTFPNNGNVGIGTTNPDDKLHVTRNQSGRYTPLILLEDSLSNGYTQVGFKGTGRTYHIGVGAASESGFNVANKLFFFDLDGNAMRMVINTNGNVGIGTATPGNRLSIYSATANTSGLQFSRLNNTANAGNPNGKVLSLDNNGNVILVRDSSGTSGWGLTGNSGANPATNFFGTTDNQDLAFRSNNVERFRLLANGNLRIGSGTDKGKTFQVYGTGFFNGAVGIGTDSIGAPGYKLFVADGIRTRKVRVDIAAWPDYVFHPGYELLPLGELDRFISQNRHLPGIASADEVSKEGIDLGDTQAALLQKIEELTLYIIEHNKELQQLRHQVDQQQQRIGELYDQLKQRLQQP